MSATSLDIYHLISRLSATEKSYYKKFGYKTSKDDRNTLALFGIIEKQLTQHPNVDEKLDRAVTKKFCANNDHRLFSKVKTVLYQDLLNALRQYDKAKQSDEKVFEQYQFASILVRKNLFKEALVFLRKAEKLCNEHDFFELLMLVQQLHAFALSRLVSEQKSDEVIACLDNVMEDCEKVLNICVFQVQYFKLAFLQKRIGIVADKSATNELETLVDSTSALTPLTTRASVYHFEAKSVAALLKGNQQESLECYSRIVELLDEHPGVRDNNLFKYLVVYELFLQMTILSAKVNEFEYHFKRFRSTTTYSEQEKVWKENSEVFLLCIFGLVSGSIKMYYELEKRFAELTSKSEYLIPGYRKISTAYYMVSGLFMLNEYEKATGWFQYINNNRAWGVRYDVDSATRMMAIISYYKLENYQLAENLLTNTRNFFRAKGKFQSEHAFCSLMGRLLRSVKSERKTVLKAAKQEWTDLLEKHPEEAVLQSVFDVVLWISSEIEDVDCYKLWYRKNIGVELV
jgi:tetratricopeptide (TPR) repeat protein